MRCIVSAKTCQGNLESPTKHGQTMSNINPTVMTGTNGFEHIRNAGPGYTGMVHPAHNGRCTISTGETINRWTPGPLGCMRPVKRWASMPHDGPPTTDPEGTNGGGKVRFHPIRWGKLSYLSPPQQEKTLDISPKKSNSHLIWWNLFSIPDSYNWKIN